MLTQHWRLSCNNCYKIAASVMPTVFTVMPMLRDIWLFIKVSANIVPTVFIPSDESGDIRVISR